MARASGGPPAGGRYFAALVRLLPRAFRARNGDAMRDLFVEMRGELGPRVSVWRLTRFYVATTWDVIRRVRYARSRTPLRRTPRQEGIVTHWIDDLRQDVVFALRGLRRAPGFALVAVLTLAIGIGANAAIFSAVNGILLQPLPYPDPDRLVLIFNRYPTLGIERAAMNPGDYLDYRQQTDAFERLSAFGGTHTQTLTGLGPAARVTLSSATDELFPLLGVQPVLGRLFRADDEFTHAIVSYGFWQSRLGGTTDAVGRTFGLNGQTYTVIGVLPNAFALHAPSHLGLPRSIAVWTPIRRFLGSNEQPDRTAHWMTVVAKLAPEVSVEQAQAQLDRVAEWQRANFAVRAERDARIDVVSLHDEIVTAVRPTLVALFGAVGFVLVIACANVANLLLAKGQGRARELAVRGALGASRRRLVRQLLTESFALAAVGGAGGIAIAYLGVDLVLALRPDNLPLANTVVVDRGVLAFVVAAAVGSTALFGLFPALAGARSPFAAHLGSRVGAAGSRAAGRFRAVLVVGEVALSMILLAGGGLMVRSFFLLGRESPGYRTDNVLTFVAGVPNGVWQGRNGQLKTGLQEFYRRAQDAVATVPGVESVGTIWPTPLLNSGEGFSTYTDSEEPGSAQSQLASSQLVTPGYFETMGIPILAGRSLSLQDGPDKLMIDQRMADKMWPGQNPIGKRLEIGWWSGPVWGEVVGVAANVRSLSIREDDPETVYRKAAVFAYSPPTFVVRTAGDPMQLADAVRRAMQSLDATVALERVRPLSELRDDQLATTRFVMTLITIFAAVALVFAAVGLYGVISYLVGQRTREIGIRLAFGARTGQVFALVMRQGLALTAVGIGLGIAGALATTRMLSSYLFGVEPTDPVTLGAIAAILAVVALIACARPAARATNVDPAQSLAVD